MRKLAAIIFLLAMFYVLVVTLPVVLMEKGHPPVRGGIGVVVVWLPFALGLFGALGLVLPTEATRRNREPQSGLGADPRLR
jgi:hypothetical protein